MAPRRSGRALAVATAPIRCATYARVSTDAQADKEFNSIEAQCQACETYVGLHREEGWTVVEHYQDSGCSGSNTNRPALKRLLAEIEAGLVDVVAVYKFDRLSRTMLDFLQLLNFFKRHGVSFVSVSQRFDTSTPVGEMTLNILLSFAQFERQIIAERTRDKIHAARRRGRWTGGVPPFGYDVAAEGGALVVNKAEAEQVRAIFEMYAELGSVMKTVEELNRRGWRRKSWTTKKGKRNAGSEWNKSTLRNLLTDPLYSGLQKLGNETFAGEHKAIISKALFEQVQQILDENRSNGGAGHRNRHGALLRGLIRCANCDASMTHTSSKGRGEKHYRYYRCTASLKRGASRCPTRSVSAPKIEDFIVGRIRSIGQNPDLQRETFDQAVAQTKAHLRGLQAEGRRLKRDLTTARKPIESLVSALAETAGRARSPVQSQLDKAQERVETLERRQVEIKQQRADLEAQTIDPAEVARALEAFDPLWDVLLTPEKERVLKLLIEQIDYSGETEKLEIQWRLPGFAELANEIGEIDP